MPHATPEARVESLWSTYEAAVASLAEEVIRQDVLPLLKRRRYRMLSGNGTFYIEDRNGKQLETDPRHLGGPACLDPMRNDLDYLAVLEILTTPIPGMPGMCLGSFGLDFPEGRR
jgi:hypothetical protein